MSLKQLLYFVRDRKEKYHIDRETCFYFFLVAISLKLKFFWLEA